MLFSVLYAPFFMSFVWPVCRHFRIGKIVCGAEVESLNAFASWAAAHYRAISAGVTFDQHLTSLTKYHIVSTLHLKYPALARHQNSCHFRTDRRWCCRCEKCFRNYFILKNIGVDLKAIGLDETVILSCQQGLIKQTVCEMVSSSGLAADWRHIFQQTSDPVLRGLQRKIGVRYRLTQIKDFLSLFVRRYAPWLYQWYRRAKALVAADPAGAQKRVLVLGHINCRNKGDEAILKVLLENYPGSTEVLVITEDLDYDQRMVPATAGQNKIRLINYYRLPGYCRLWNRTRRLLQRDFLPDWHMRTALNERLRHVLLQADQIIISGRDQLTECYGQDSFDKWVTQLETAVQYCDQVFLLGCSVDDLSPDNAERLRRAMLSLRMVTCREMETLTYIQGLDSRIKCRYAPDPAFALAATVPQGVSIPAVTRPVIGFALSGGLLKYANLEEADYTRVMADAIDAVLDRYQGQAVFIPHVSFPNSINNDYEFGQRVAREMKNSGAVHFLPPDLPAEEYKYLIGRCDYFVGARTHTTISALSQGVPCVVIEYSRKARGIFRDFYGHDRYVLPVTDLLQGKLPEMFAVLAQDHPPGDGRLRKRAAEIVEQTRRSFEMITEK